MPIAKLTFLKFLFLLCLVSLGVKLRAQDVFQLTDLPKDKGLVLNQNWKYITGDNPGWASPDFNDHSWSPIDPTVDITRLPQLVPGKIGWFRLQFQAKDLSSQELSMVLQQSGAAEYFLDGKLIHRFGVVSEDASAIRAFDPLFKPVALILTEKPLHVLAIRFVLQPGARYTTMFEARNPAFQIRVYFFQDAINAFQFATHSMNGFLLYISGTCFLLFFLHLAFYLFDPSQKGNLAFALFALGFLLFNVLQFRLYFYSNYVPGKFYLGNLAMDLRVACNLFLLSALYNILNRPRDWYFWILISLSIVSFFLNVWPYDIGWKIGGASMEILIGAGITRVAYLATKEKKRGARIIFIGAIFYFIFFTVFFYMMILVAKDAFFWSLPLPRIILYVLSFLSIPIAISLYLGLDFAFANRSLKQNLLEVKELSAKNIRQEKEKQDILAAQNETLEQLVNDRTNELTQSLKDLKATQAQLIQSEKMASLGELTAGIAHEIKNPLNFVNNFSEVNTELISEMKQEISRNNLDEAIGIANMISDNEQKITLHGKRADAIVKGMLEHSRKSTGLKELTNINKLVDENLHLAFTGFQATEKSFSAIIQTDYDQQLESVQIIPQDIGRVLLNLLSNAFYAVAEKEKQSDADYEPIVTVITRKLIDGNLHKGVEIVISDNGNGIPQINRDKIFQPFFTTKPTGQGTGLGLSLSYDIITKGHNGRLMVEPEEGKGAIFVIQLPTE